MRLVVDTIIFGAREVPRWNPVSISGYHIREAGSTAVQELAFTLRDGIEYVEWVARRGCDVDEFAPRLSFFFNAHNDLFEEVAKYRAARKVWARVMRERFGAKNQRTPRRMAVCGMSCMIPTAPLGDVAQICQPDSCSTTARAKSIGTP
jgi:methylmalonyl-CoA mutase, N-terminal domain